jgi:hypothetical protein
MSNQPSYFSLSSSQSAELRSFLSRGDGFYQLPSSQLPTVIPEALRRKWDSASVIISGSTGPSGAMAVVGHRPDLKSGMLDHDPFVVAVSASVPGGSGVLLHHASYTSRSFQLPDEYVAALSSSGLTNYFVENPPSGSVSGSYSEAPQPLKDALRVTRSFLSSSAT